ncbi:30S ribosomal protein S8 [Candidatus Gottesmanbacteria bacterium]|nr:30S ribosomal protein S8 [Candidatus Gottesmanbacteria bacterium]
MTTDPIADMLSAIKNAVLARHKTVAFPYSKVKESIAKTLVDEGYLATIATGGVAPKQMLTVEISYNGSQPVITDIKRKSKPGLRVYVSTRDIRQVLGGLGSAIISTPQGVMSGKEAKKRGLGGELICEVW